MNSVYWKMLLNPSLYWLQLLLLKNNRSSEIYSDVEICKMATCFFLTLGTQQDKNLVLEILVDHLIGPKTLKTLAHVK